MKAVIQTQGRQFTVQEGDILKVNRYPNTEAGSTIEISNILLIETEAGIRLGSPVLDNSLVRAKILENKRDKKVMIFKRKRRKGYRRKRGHRQELSVIKIEAIETK